MARSLAIAFVIMLIVGAALFGFLWKRKQAKNRSEVDEVLHAYSISGFTMSWLAMTAYGTIAVFAVWVFSSFIGNIFTVLVSITTSAVERVAASNDKLSSLPDTWRLASRVYGGFFALVLVGYLLPTGYLLGRWIGARVSRNGVLALLVAVVIGEVAGTVFGHLLLDIDDFAGWVLGDLLLALAGGGTMATTLDPGTLRGSWALLWNVCLIVVPGLVGYTRGRKAKPRRYMGYLLGLSSEDTQQALVSMVEEQARRRALGKPNLQRVG